MSNLSKGTSNTVHGYTIIKLNITIAALKIDHIRNYPKNSPIPFPRLSPTLNFSFSFKRSIACNERKQKRIFRAKGERCSVVSAPFPRSKRRRGGGGEGASCPAKVAKRGLSPTYTISGPHTHRALYFASRYCPGGSESVLKFPQRRTRISSYVSGQQKRHSREYY